MPYRKTPLSVQINKSRKLLIGTLLFLLVGTSTYFFIKVSATAEKGAVIREGQFEQRELELKNRLLKQQVLEAQSINEIKSSEAISTMESPREETYVEPVRPISSTNDEKTLR
ncbi:hypothetical protein CO046_04635 [Candidatus Peregrinibacteria bacterium CG_4_9_14_0_2_um_filter_53_11]|nr:MAG: hypothetical protein CO046_04635 [Candidatus Peregrinibacteria bacterium CG_4_9_14_0_2_um_filter_53_11]